MDMYHLLFLIGVVSSVTWFQLYYTNQITNAENVDRYWLVLSGDEQTPPVLTDAHGFVGFKFAEDFNKLVYIVSLNIQESKQSNLFTNFHVLLVYQIYCQK
jgi:hypothetical protein